MSEENVLNSVKILKDLEKEDKEELKEGRSYLPLEKIEGLELSELVSITSSNINRIGYTTDGNLLVRFNNLKEYLYSEVPKDIYEELKKADSVGTNLSKNIKGKYRFFELKQQDQEAKSSESN